MRSLEKDSTKYQIPENCNSADLASKWRLMMIRIKYGLDEVRSQSRRAKEGRRKFNMLMGLSASALAPRETDRRRPHFVRSIILQQTHSPDCEIRNFGCLRRHNVMCLTASGLHIFKKEEKICSRCMQRTRLNKGISCLPMFQQLVFVHCLKCLFLSYRLCENELTSGGGDNHATSRREIFSAE